MGLNPAPEKKLKLSVHREPEIAAEKDGTNLTNQEESVYKQLTQAAEAATFKVAGDVIRNTTASAGSERLINETAQDIQNQIKGKEKSASKTEQEQTDLNQNQKVASDLANKLAQARIALLNKFRQEKAIAKDQKQSGGDSSDSTE